MTAATWLANLTLPNMEAAQRDASIPHGTPVLVRYQYSRNRPPTPIERQWGSIYADPAIRTIAFRDDNDGRAASAALVRWLEGLQP